MRTIYKNAYSKNSSLHTHMYPSDKYTFFQVLFKTKFNYCVYKIQLPGYILSQLDPTDTM